MRGANMSVVGRAVVKRLATRTTSERALDSSLVVCFQVTIEIRLRLKPFLAAGTFVGFLPSVDALMGLQIIQTSKCFSAVVATILLALFLG